MKVASFVKATALLSAAAFVATTGVAEAQTVDKDNAKCRATIQKNAGKLQATASKAIVGCWKSVLGGKIPYQDCNDSLAADSKGKINKAAQKLRDAVGGAKTKCELPLHQPSLDVLVDCPSPGAEGAGMTSFGQVGNCLAGPANNVGGVATIMADNMHRAASNPGPAQVQTILDDDVNGKAIAKCHGALQKSFNKIISTVGKTEGGEQAKNLDKNGGPYEYGASGLDPKGKIAKTVTKLNDQIAKSCAPLTQAQFALLRTCGDLSNVGACLEEIAKNGSSGTTAVSFEMPGTCPGSVIVSGKTRQSNGDTASATVLNAGWTGFGQNGELLSFDGQVNLTCTDGTCSNCTVSTNCGQGNCRCDNDRTIECDEPFAADADDCGGATCRVFFGAPLPLSAAGTPTCVVTEIQNELVGTADVGTGASTTEVNSTSTVFTGLNQAQPCPTCSGGVCDSGERSGLACNGNNGTSPDFGSTSYDCPPALVSNISGSGLQIDLVFSDAPADLDANVPCVGPLSAFDCHCAQCSGDTSVPCNSDADCAAVAAGTCTSAGSGVNSQPNGCADFVAGCSVDGDGKGNCTGGAADETMFCDGLLRVDGSGIVTCANDASCDAVDCGSGVGVGLCGTCSTVGTQNCLANEGDSISIAGTFGSQDAAVLGSNFCIPPTASGAVNGAAGTPGPGSLRIAWDFQGLCDDGVTPYTLGGTTCP